MIAAGVFTIVALLGLLALSVAIGDVIGAALSAGATVLCAILLAVTGRRA